VHGYRIAESDGQAAGGAVTKAWPAAATAAAEEAEMGRG